jgi:hypothetical protein
MNSVFDIDLIPLILNKLTERECVILCISNKKFCSMIYPLIKLHYLSPLSYISRELANFFQLVKYDGVVYYQHEIQTDFLTIYAYIQQQATFLASHYSFDSLRISPIDTHILIKVYPFYNVEYMNVMCSFKIRFIRRQKRYSSYVISFLVRHIDSSNDMNQVLVEAAV